MFKGFLKIIIVIGIVIVLIYAGLTCYANFVDSGQSSNPDAPAMPNPEKARFNLRIVNTGGTILTDTLVVEGEAVGSRVFTLTGYWELGKGNKFTYRGGDLILDETIFGEIKVRKR